MKKILKLLIAIVLIISTVFGVGCSSDLKKKYEKNIEQEMKGSFDFFWNEVSLKEQVSGSDNPTYGLIADRYPNTSQTSSIASVGFGLTAYVVGVEEGYVTKEQAEERSLKTLKTMLVLQKDDTTSYNGFLAHFINMTTGKRQGNNEISSVDTAILLMGALTAGEYFKGEVQTLANELYANVNWNAMLNTRSGKTYLSMGYSLERKTLLGNWDWYAEQLMMYVLGSGSPKEEHRIDKKAYYDFTRKKGKYKENEYIYSWFGSIFTHQFSHAFIDFRNICDENGTNWFDNSVAASKAAYEFCQDRKEEFKTFKEGGWGLTACDTMYGYSGKLGSEPRGWNKFEDSDYSDYEATIAPCGAIGSVVFTPEESLKALKKYQSYEKLKGEYGLKDAYTLDGREWFAPDSIGIDKGITLLMLSNYKNEGVWSVVMKNESIKSGLENLGFVLGANFER